jgi:hypothetical protein
MTPVSSHGQTILNGWSTVAINYYSIMAFDALASHLCILSLFSLVRVTNRWLLLPSCIPIPLHARAAGRAKPPKPATLEFLLEDSESIRFLGSARRARLLNDPRLVAAIDYFPMIIHVFPEWTVWLHPDGLSALHQHLRCVNSYDYIESGQPTINMVNPAGNGTPGASGNGPFLGTSETHLDICVVHVFFCVNYEHEHMSCYHVFTHLHYKLLVELWN